MKVQLFRLQSVEKTKGRDHFWALLFVDQITGQTRQSSFFKTPKLSIEIKYAIINACLKELRCRLCENTHVLHHPGKSWLLHYNEILIINIL